MNPPLISIALGAVPGVSSQTNLETPLAEQSVVMWIYLTAYGVIFTKVKQALCFQLSTFYAFVMF